MSTRQWRPERLSFLALSASLVLVTATIGCDDGAPTAVEPSASTTPAAPADTAAPPAAEPTGLPEAELPPAPGMEPDPTAQTGEILEPVQTPAEDLLAGSMPEIAPPAPSDDPAGEQMNFGSTVSGVSLGMSPDEVVAVLGAPSALPTEENAFAATTWPGRGFTAEWTNDPQSGVHMNAFVVAGDSDMVNGSAIGIGTPRVYVDMVYAVDGIERAETDSTLVFTHDDRTLRFAFDAEGKVTEIGAGIL